MSYVYETPAIIVVEAESEGVLCMSSNFETWEEEDVI